MMHTNELRDVMCEGNIRCYHENNNEVIYYDTNEKIFTSCTLDNIRTRWDYLGDSGFKIKDVISFYHKHRLFVRMIVDDPKRTSKKFCDIAKVEFALGNMTYGISYIIPMTVWEKRNEEIVCMFHCE